MLHHAPADTSANDFSAYALALLDFLSQRTAVTPLADCGFIHCYSGTDELWVFSATEAGLPHQNLNIAVGWRMVPEDGHDETEIQGYATTGFDGARPYILVVSLLPHNPADDLAIGDKMNYHNLLEGLRMALEQPRSDAYAY